MPQDFKGFKVNSKFPYWEIIREGRKLPAYRIWKNSGAPGWQLVRCIPDDREIISTKKVGHRLTWEEIVSFITQDWHWLYVQ